VLKIDVSEPTPRQNRAFGEDDPEHFPAMGEALAGRRRWIWIAAAVVVLALIGYGVVHALTADASAKPKAAATSAADLGDGLDVHEVDDLADVRLLQPECLGIAVDADNAQAQLLGAPDRTPLMAARADEEHRPLHGPRL
jgi:hypothetical protein